MIPILQMRKLRQLAEGHTDNEWQSRDLNPDYLAPDSLTTRLSCLKRCSLATSLMAKGKHKGYIGNL